jgi:glucan phosphoethanolaminetransferase (alkaline phosphatase superfamily)
MIIWGYNMFLLYFSQCMYMNKKYFTLLVYIFVSLIIVYLIKQVIIMKITRDYESFTPKINSMYRPYVRRANTYYETFINNYGAEIVLNKLKKWNIY